VGQFEGRGWTFFGWADGRISSSAASVSRRPFAVPHNPLIEPGLRHVISVQSHFFWSGIESFGPGLIKRNELGDECSFPQSISPESPPEPQSESLFQQTNGSIEFGRNWQALAAGRF
jgi:hypothetical protein